MASYLTDEERERRYAKLRKKKKVCEFLFAVPILTGIVLFIAGLFSLPGVFADIMMGSSVLLLFVMLFPLASSAAAIFGAFSRNLRIIAVTSAAIVLMDILSQNTLSIPLIPGMICAAIGAVLWSKLEEEEGFPLFRIPFSELEERNQTAEKKIRARAEAAGVRRTADERIRGEMGDLLDEAENVPVQISALRGYHERGEGSQSVFSAPMNDAGEYGKMDEL